MTVTETGISSSLCSQGTGHLQDPPALSPHWALTQELEAGMMGFFPSLSATGSSVWHRGGSNATQGSMVAAEASPAPFCPHVVLGVAPGCLSPKSGVSLPTDFLAAQCPFHEALFCFTQQRLTSDAHNSEPLQWNPATAWHSRRFSPSVPHRVASSLIFLNRKPLQATTHEALMASRLHY